MGSNNCKLEFGKRWASQLFYLEEIGIAEGKMGVPDKFEEVNHRKGEQEG